jgi:hypothetical protein
MAGPSHVSPKLGIEIVARLEDIRAREPLPGEALISNEQALRGPSAEARRGRTMHPVYNRNSTVSSLDSQTNSVVRMTLLGVFV